MSIPFAERMNHVQNEKNTNKLRLNFTNSDEPVIEKCIKPLAGAIKQLVVKK
jgi:hypothetical protein